MRERVSGGGGGGGGGRSGAAAHNQWLCRALLQARLCVCTDMCTGIFIDRANGLSLTQSVGGYIKPC